MMIETILFAVCLIGIAFLIEYLMFKTDKEVNELEDMIPDDGAIDELIEVVNYNAETVEKAVNSTFDDMEKISKMTCDICGRLSNLEGISNLMLMDTNRTIENMSVLEEILHGMEDRLEELEEKNKEYEDRIFSLEGAMVDNELNDIKMKDKVADIKETQEFIYDTVMALNESTSDTFNDFFGCMDYFNDDMTNMKKAMDDLYTVAKGLKEAMEVNYDAFLGFAEEMDNAITAQEREITDNYFNINRLDMGAKEMYNYIQDLVSSSELTVKELSTLKESADKTSKALKRETDIRKLEKLWKEANDRYDLFKRAMEEGYPEEILDKEYSSYLNYFNVASLAQQRFNGQDIPVKGRYR